MDVLRDVSEGIFDSPDLFTENEIAGDYATVRIRATPDSGAVETESIGRKVTELLDLFDTSSTLQSSLDLIQMHRPLGPDVGIHGRFGSQVETPRRFDPHADFLRECIFSRLLQSMNVDPRVLYLIRRDYDGFHYYWDEADLFTGYIGMPAYVLVWTSHVNATATKTTALFLPKSRDPLPEFAMLLQMFRKYVHSPYLLAYVSVIHIVHMFDRETAQTDLYHLRYIEHRTGYGPREREDFEPKSVDDLSAWSQMVGERQVAFTNKIRSLRASEDVMRFISDECKSHRGQAYRYPQSIECTRQLNETLPALRRQIDTLRDYLQYLKERAEKLMEVLFALTTNEHAHISLRLLEEAHRDSASMRTIAIMTMAFLPATFLAALFAMSPVIQDSFWVYWAWAIPVTTVVFLIWAGIVQRSNFLSVVRWLRGVRSW